MPPARSIVALLLLALSACTGDKDPTACPDGAYPDSDGDGYGNDSTGCGDGIDTVSNHDDCDDASADRFPGNAEVPGDGIDQDCDGSDAVSDTGVADTDEQSDTDNDTAVEPADSDHDGFPDDEDCDPFDDDAFPDAVETCDGTDNDCDGETDEDAAADAAPWYADADGDGYGDPEASTVACSAPDGFTDDASDCDDADPSVHPGAEEDDDGLDDDCDGSIDEGTDTVDDDGDGYSEAGGDCDDGSSGVHPGSDEIPYDGLDQDCSGADLTDVDSDGYDASEVGGGDPDDTDPDTYPGSPAYDDDGDGEADDEGDPDDEDPAVTSATDADGDGYPIADDCDDALASAYPGRPETCDGVDNDCDGEIDESGALGERTWYIDVDGDGGGSDWDGLGVVGACEPPGGYVASDDDCDDTDATICPACEEICDGLDDDCDGETDEGLPWSTWYDDDDGDSYGDDDESVEACEAPEGSAELGGDCDDGDPDVYPKASETPGDEVDADCDGTEICYVDLDGDGYPSTTTITSSDADCDDSYEIIGSDDEDCDDDDAWVYPGAPEVCDGQPNDCDTRDTWAETDEYGLVSYLIEDGSATDLSEVLSTDDDTVTEYRLSQDGVLSFCVDPDDLKPWYVNLSVSSVDVSITGVHSADSVVLSGGGEGSVVFALSASLELEGLTLRDGAASYYSVSGGGAIFSYDTALTIQDCTLTDNHVDGYGGALYAYSGSVTIQDSLVSHNSATMSGGGLNMAASSLELASAKFSPNPPDRMALDRTAFPPEGRGAPAALRRSGRAREARRCRGRGGIRKEGGRTGLRPECPARGAGG